MIMGLLLLIPVQATDKQQTQGKLMPLKEQ